jgi:hypothetical protein
MPDITPAIADLSAVLDEYWDWLHSQPQWAGFTRVELQRRYRGSAQHDGPDYEQLVERLNQAVVVVVEQARDTGCLAPAKAALLEAVLLDELWEGLLDLCTSTLPPPLRADLLRAGLAHWAIPVRLLCAERTGDFPFAGAEDLLDNAVAHADPIDVRRYALLALAKLAPARAVAWAESFLSPLHPDEYLVIASMDILAEHAPSRLSPWIPALSKHPSKYVRLRTSPGGFPAGPHLLP